MNQSCDRGFCFFFSTLVQPLICLPPHTTTLYACVSNATDAMSQQCPPWLQGHNAHIPTGPGRDHAHRGPLPSQWREATQPATAAHPISRAQCTTPDIGPSHSTPAVTIPQAQCLQCPPTGVALNGGPLLPNGRNLHTLPPSYPSGAMPWTATLTVILQLAWRSTGSPPILWAQPQSAVPPSHPSGVRPWTATLTESKRGQELPSAQPLPKMDEDD